MNGDSENDASMSSMSGGFKPSERVHILKCLSNPASASQTGYERLANVWDSHQFALFIRACYGGMECDMLMLMNGIKHVYSAKSGKTGAIDFIPSCREWMESEKSDLKTDLILEQISGALFGASD